MKGIVAGFTLAAPGEAIGFLEIKETERSIAKGIMTGLAAASADFLYGVLAVLLLILCDPFLSNYQTASIIIGGIFLCGFGIERFFNTLSFSHVKSIDGSIKKIFFTTFIFTLTNASTILEFIALFIGFDIEFTGYHELLIFVSGVFFGSLIWWLSLSIIDKVLKKRKTQKILCFLNYASGFAIFSFGLYTLTRLFFN